MESIQKQINQVWAESPRQAVLADDSVAPGNVSEQMQLIVRMFNHISRLSWALGGMTVGVLFTLLALQAIPFRHGAVQAQSMIPVVNSDEVAGASTDLQLANRTSNERLDLLMQQLQTLTAVVASLQGNAADLQTGNATKQVPSTTPDSDAVAVDETVLNDLPAPASGKTVSTEEPHGEWVVNLASLPSKEAADQLLAKAAAQHIPGSLDMIKVEGKTFWRVQATGFESFTQAKSNIGAIEQKLDTRGAWVMERTN